ncbi:MAG: helix-turn-helix transcriptional regulator [Pantoea sp.]|uniref:helix-turn-helix domain-containing protein n=1 Tax=Pantoea sp. TaxID=69393 RepID=UPI002383F015|nr:helix-turn-helix transcriptional regulator [Pantoea sp.]MDE1184943.1 helix-turn-helix transcriptional regulator [Pantoea sp.]
MNSALKLKSKIPQLQPQMLTPAPSVVSYFYTRQQAQAWHSHATAQLTYCSSGAVTIHTAEASWTLPPYRALWIPSGLTHQTHAQAGTQTHNLYLTDAGEKKCIEALCPLLITRLVHQLVTELDDLPQHQRRNLLILALLFNELSQAQSAQVSCLPVAKEPRLLTITGALLQQPGNNATLESLGNQAGITPRTLSRLFRQETGLSFAQWRQQLTITTTINQLSQGMAVEEIASQLGYCNGSALIAMFSKTLGLTPQRYFALQG